MMACFPGLAARRGVRRLPILSWMSRLTEPISFDVEDILGSESRAAIVGALRTRINATDKIIATQFAIILTIECNFVTRFQMLEDSFDVSKAAHA